MEILLKIAFEKCNLNCSKKKHSINIKQNEIVDCLRKNNSNLAMAKMENILKDENEIAIYESLKPFLEILKEKTIFIISNDQCPSEIKNILDTVLYASIRVEIDELKSFREEMIKKYGNEFVTKAEKNMDKSVNEDLVEKLQPKIFKEELIKLRLKQLCHLNNIKCSLTEDVIPGDDLLANNLINKNPYASTIISPKLDNKEGENKIQDSNLIINKPDKSKVFTQITSEINGLYSKTKVTQKFSNPFDGPLELKVYISKKGIINFSSFECQIGDSIKVKSKIIKEEKAKEKYVDSISSGNAAIFIAYDQNDKDTIIINLGNLPPKSDIIFISYFISPMETSNNKYEFEFFRNLPIFKGKEDEIYQNSEIKGEITIKSNNEIINIQKEILMEELLILEEKLSSVNPYIYRLMYKIEFPNLVYDSSDPYGDYNPYYLYYMVSSKIYFDLNINQPLALIQEGNKESIEKFYYIQHRFKLDQIQKENQDQEMNPCLFIFLIDQSGSMYGKSMELAKKALIIFLQSIPSGSFYQIIGFGSSFKDYDYGPKKYNKENIKESIKIIENLSADLGGTNIYDPLKSIFGSHNYDYIYSPKNIFLITDGGVENESEVLNLIELNNSRFTIHSIGIGEYFDENLIKNMGVIGKGYYNFCKNLDKLNSIIASEVNKCCGPRVTDVKLNCNLDNKNTIKNIVRDIIREDDIINLYYITNDNSIESNIQLKMEYKDKNDVKYEKNYEINPEILDKGDDLSKLIIYDYIRSNNNLSQEEKIKLAIKYQIFIEGTSLFAEIELDEKISSEMKLKILGEKDQNLILKKKETDIHLINSNYSFGGSDDILDRYDCCKMEGFANKESNDNNNDNYLSNNYDNNKEKDEFMKMVNSQDFIEGYWEQNEYTKIIIEKYEKEYNLIKGLKNKNIDDKTAITILVIYFINKEHANFLNDLLMIIKKAKKFIQKTINDSYENIIKEANIN